MNNVIGSPDQAAAFLESLVLDEPRCYATRAAQAQQAVAALLARLGNPHHGLPVIHVTGSKGKGSTALLVEAILRAAGLKVGTYTSPHLSHWRERFRLNGTALPETDFAALMEHVRPAVEALLSGPGNTRPGFFDTATAAALLLFRRAGVEAAIVEVGIGGRLDATNVVEPRVCCITGVELEHTDKLGDTVAAIAAEKAGIIKPGVTTVCGPLTPAAARVVTQRAKSQAAPLLCYGDAFYQTSTPYALGYEFAYHAPGLRIDCSLALPGAHQTVNAALAIACARQFGIAELPKTVQLALSTVRLPGRCEILGKAPWLVVDGAHTVASARALREVIERLPATRRHWLLSFTKGKSPGPTVAELLSDGDRVTITRADPQRSQAPQAIAAQLAAWAPGLSMRCIDDPAHALEQVRAELAEHDLLAVAGSVYLAGRVRALLGTHITSTAQRAA